MNTLVEALGPIFVASFALQQLLELLDPALEMLIKRHKAWIMSSIAFVFGLLLTGLLNLRLLNVFGVSRFDWLDGLLTALFISGGTKWLNDLLKIVQYRKLEVRARAMIAQEQANMS
ncbi:MAG: hypothetical protein PVH60_03080 [Anaerolineales bacterium]|jgi:hypothetical protein